MDFLTAFPYWFILLVVVINAIVVRNMDVEVKNDETSSNNSGH